MSDAAPHIVCAFCTATNRVPLDKDASEARCGKCHRPLFDGHPFAATVTTFPKHIQSSDIPVVVDFWAEWCGPCRMMAPIFEKAAAEFEPRMRFLKVDTEAERSLAAQFGIRSIPTLMIFKGGKIAVQQAGAMDANSLRAWLRHNI